MFREDIERSKSKAPITASYHNNQLKIQDQSPSSSQVSLHSNETLLHTHKNQTHKVTTVTKVVHEVKHICPDAAMVDYVAMPLDDQIPETEGPTVDYVTMPVAVHSRSQYINFNQLEQPNRGQQIYLQEGNEFHPHYQEYEHYPAGGQYPNSSGYNAAVPRTAASASYLSEYSSNDRTGTPQTPNEHSSSTSPLPAPNQAHGMIPLSGFLQTSQYDEMQDYRITPSPGEPVDNRYSDDTGLIYGYVSTTHYGLPTNSVAVHSNSYTTRPILFEDNLNGSTSGLQGLPHTSIYEDDQELQKHISHLSMHPHSITTSPRGASDIFLGSSGESSQTLRWRDPNLSEVISFLNNSNNTIKANAAAYLQHLCYMDDPNKQRTRTLGGIPPLVQLLSHDMPEVHKNSCGALRNLSYGRQNDENKRAIKNAGGIAALIHLLCRSQESEIKELVTGVIWNMSSCEDLKRQIIDDGLNAIVTNIIKSHSGWDPVCPGDTCSSTVFRNASGVLRNVSSAGEYARTKLRECENLVDCLLYVVRTAIEKSNIGNKIVENCVCILRNLSYRCQEVEDPNYDKHPIPTPARTSTPSSSKGENLGCFGATKKKKECLQNEPKENSSLGNIGPTSRSAPPSNISFKGYDQLWQPEVVQFYLSLLQSCSNPETLEAAAGAIQNLSACYWQPSVEIRAAVRKEKGLPILVELLRMEVDRVVCAVATALRNLAIDQRNKELIGKYAMRDLVQKLPSGNPQHDLGTSDDTVTAVLATVNEVIKKNTEFSRSLLDAGGVERLMNITRQRQKYTSCVLKFASQVLFTLWQHQELRDVYKKHGWKEQDFVTKTVAARNAAPNSPNNANNTLNRPMASQGRTRYEDRTIKRGPGSSERCRNNGGLSNSINEMAAIYKRTEDISTGINQVYQQNDRQTAGAIYPPIIENGPNHSN